MPGMHVFPGTGHSVGNDIHGFLDFGHKKNGAHSHRLDPKVLRRPLADAEDGGEGAENAEDGDGAELLPEEPLVDGWGRARLRRIPKQGRGLPASDMERLR